MIKASRITPRLKPLSRLEQIPTSVSLIFITILRPVISLAGLCISRLCHLKKLSHINVRHCTLFCELKLTLRFCRQYFRLDKRYVCLQLFRSFVIILFQSGLECHTKKSVALPSTKMCKCRPDHLWFSLNDPFQPQLLPGSWASWLRSRSDGMVAGFYYWIKVPNQRSQ